MMNRRAAVVSAVVGGVVGLTAFGAVASAWMNDGGSAAPNEPSTTVEAPAPSMTSTLEATTTTDAPPATVVVTVPGPAAPPDTSGDLEQRVTNVEKRVSTIESTIAAEPPAQAQPSPPQGPPATAPSPPAIPPTKCDGRPIDPATGYCT